MLNFEEEIKKFKPSLGLDHIGKDMKNDNMSDLLDVIKKLTQIEKGKTNNNSKEQ